MTTMPGIEALLAQPAAQAVGWALLQFVWQGAAVGGLTAFALLALRRSASDVRYVVASISLALMLTLPVVTGVQKFNALTEDAPLPAPTAMIPTEAPAGAARVSAMPLRQAAPPRAREIASGWLSQLQLEAFLPALMLVWLAGVSVLSLRLLTGWVWVQRLRTRGVIEANETCRRMTARLARRLHISRAVTLLESRLVEVPTVIGFLRPVVLLPASVLGGLSPQQLEAILAHELAHIRRHDYLVNLLQTLVETVLFYHPAVWWLSRRIRIERENCCDDLAVSLCGDPVAYANALADLEALRSGPAPDHHIAMAATGGSLLQRVRRVLGAPSSHTGRGPAWLAGSVALLLIGGIALGAEHAPQDRSPAPVVSKVSALAVPKPFAGVLGRPAAAAAAPLMPQRALPAIAEATAEIPVVGSLAPSVAAAVFPLMPVMAVDSPAPAGSDPVVPEAPPVALARALTTSPGLPVLAAAGQQPATTPLSERRVDSSGNWTWSNDGDTLEISYRGAFDFTDDDRDVREMSIGAYLKLSDGKWFGRHSIELRERDGRIDRRYYVNGSERPYEPEGRVWLAQNLPRFIRSSGFGAEGRVARFLKSGGPSAVMAEISRIESTYAKGLYFKQLFRQATLTGEQYRQAMTQAGREMRSSNYELAQLLVSVADRLPADDAARAAYFQAASGITSSYELRRVYSTMLKRGPVSSPVLAGILDTAGRIESDYELSQLLQQIAAQQPLDDRNRTTFFHALATIDSSYERHRVLSTFFRDQRGIDPATLEAAVKAAESISSDYECAAFLLEVLRSNSIEGTPRAAFFKVVSGIDSNYERGRVLQTIARKTDASSDTLKALLRATSGMSGHELSQVLQAVAKTHAITGEVRDAYLDAADRLTGYEQGQVLTALVRSERRR